MRRLTVIALLVALGLSALWLALGAWAEIELRSESVDEQPEVELATPDALAQVAHEPEAQRSPAAAAPVARTTSRPAPSAANSSSPIAGRVVRPDGTPVPDAEVELEYAEPFRSKLGPITHTKTDAQGRFGLECERTGPFRVQATEYEKKRIVGQAVREDVYPRRGEVELVLQPALARGRVVDDLERPITDFRITWTPLAPDGRREPSGAGERFRSASGEFSSLLSPGTWRASIDAHGDYVTAQVELEVPTLVPLAVVLARKGIVRGVVVDDAGKPVARAQLSAPDVHVLTDTSKQDGSFELKVTPDTPFTLWAEDARHAPSPRTRLSLAPGEEHVDVVLQLGAPAHLSGEVVDPHGLAVTEREVGMCEVPRTGVWSSRMSSKTVQTDASGHFEADVAPGQLNVWAEISDKELEALGRVLPKPGSSRPSCQRTVTLAPGESAHVRLTMGGNPVRLHGRIELGGRAPADVDLRIHGFAGTGWQMLSYAAGNYEVLVPEPGGYLLMLTADGLNWQPSIDVPEQDEFRFDVSIPVGHVTGHVHDETGRALEGVVIDAYSQGEGQLVQSSARATTSGDGAYSMELLPGNYGVAPREDFEERRSFREAPAQIVLVEADAELRDVDFVLQTIGALDGRVRRADGGRLLQARVSATDLRLQPECDDLADDDSRFHLALDGGAHWLTATGNDGSHAFTLPEPVRVELEPGAVRELELTLVPAVSVRVRLVAEELALTQLEALDEHGRSFAARRQEEDLHTVLLVPGRYTLRARRVERLFERPLEVTAGPAELELDWPLE